MQIVLLSLFLPLFTVGVVVTPITNSTWATGVLPSSTYDQLYAAKFFTINVTTEAWTVIVSLNRTDSNCAGLIVQVRTMVCYFLLSTYI